MKLVRRVREALEKLLIVLLGRRLKGKLWMLPSFAAAMAFYFLVALVPFLVIVSKFAAAVFSANLTPELLEFLRDVLPPESALSIDALAESITQRSSGLAVVSTVLALWTASSGLNQLTRAVNFLFSETEMPQPNGWVLRGKALALLVIWALASVVVAVAFVILPLVHGQLIRLGGGALVPKFVAAVYRYPTAFTMLFAAFVLTYAFAPQKRPKWGAAFQGAAVAAAIWSGVSLLFAYLLPKVWHVSLFSGTLSSVLAILMWAYLGSWGALIGAVVTVRVDEK